MMLIVFFQYTLMDKSACSGLGIDMFSKFYGWIGNTGFVLVPRNIHKSATSGTPEKDVITNDTLTRCRIP